MLETVTEGFKNATERLRGIQELTEDNIAASIADVRRSLLEADVDFNTDVEIDICMLYCILVAQDGVLRCATSVLKSAIP